MCIIDKKKNSTCNFEEFIMTKTNINVWSPIKKGFCLLQSNIEMFMAIRIGTLLFKKKLKKSFILVEECF